MKILRIIESLDPKKGGPAYSVRESSRMLTEMGHQVTVLTLDHGGRRLNDAVPFEYVAIGPGLFRFGFSLRFWRWLRKHVSRFDLVAVHGIWQWPSLCYRLTAPAGQRSFVMPHGSLDVWDRDLHPAKFALKQLYWRLVEKPLFRKVTSCYFTSTAEHAAAIAQFGLDGINATTIPYGAVAAGGARLEAMATDARVFGYMGRIHPKKGFDVLLDAFASVVDHGADCRLRIAGTGDQGYLKELRARAEHLGISGCVDWVGEVSGPDKHSFLASLGLFVLPSHQENFGLAVAEALSAGTPVLISDQVNICDVVRGYKAGLVVPRSVAAFSEAMRNWHDAGLAGRVPIDRSAARRCFDERLSLNSFVLSVLEDSRAVKREGR